RGARARGGAAPAARLAAGRAIPHRDGLAGRGLLPELLRAGLLRAPLVEDGRPPPPAALQPVRRAGGRLLGLRPAAAVAPAEPARRLRRPGDGLGHHPAGEPL